jgi:hypothetical protein
MNLEKELQAALREVAPPAGLSNKVMERIDGSGRRSGLARRVAAGFVIVTLMGFAGYRQVEEIRTRREGELAKQMLMTAMRIAAEKTTVARDAVGRVSE